MTARPNGGRRFAGGFSITMLAALCALPTCAIADPGDLPDAKLTGGAVGTHNVPIVCRRGYSRSVRPRAAVWRKLKDEAYERYGLARGHRSFVDAAGHRHAAFTVDHLVPIELGGAPSDLRNLWPQPQAAAKRKDEVENALHNLVCDGRIELEAAQRAIAHDWKTALAEVLR